MLMKAQRSDLLLGTAAGIGAVIAGYLALRARRAVAELYLETPELADPRMPPPATRASGGEGPAVRSLAVPVQRPTHLLHAPSLYPFSTTIHKSSHHRFSSHFTCTPAAEIPSCRHNMLIGCMILAHRGQLVQ